MIKKIPNATYKTSNSQAIMQTQVTNANRQLGRSCKLCELGVPVSDKTRVKVNYDP